MDVPCSIQGNIHAFSLIINVSRILGTYQKSLGLFGFDYFLMLYFVPSRDACNASTLASPSTVATLFSKLTSTFVTPGTFEKRSFTVLAHPAHVIPSKLYSFFIIDLSFIVMLSSVLILGR